MQKELNFSDIKQTQEIRAKRTAKNSVFLDLFQDKKNLLKLYQTLHPEDTDATEDTLDIVTIDNVLTDNLYNDLGIMVGDDRLLLLLEAQSSWTVNILIRILLYLAQSYQKYFERTSQSLYKSTKVKMPKPELYVIYTGSRGRKPDAISLSEEFFDGAEIDIEVRAKVIYESDTEDIINQYIIFCKVFDEQRKLYGMTEQTVKETIRICKDRNILKEYLISRETEVVTIMMSLFDHEQIMKTYWKDMENTLTQTLTQSITQNLTQTLTQSITQTLTQTLTQSITQTLTYKKDRETAETLIKKGKLSLEDIAECVPTLSLDELKEIEAEVMQLA